jgi:hypothetical protein
MLLAQVEPNPGWIASGAGHIETGIRREVMHGERQTRLGRQADVNHLATHPLQTSVTPVTYPARRRSS